ncbi:transglycosylase SLT domain-containing protein [Fertoeibacter niger]
MQNVIQTLHRTCLRLMRLTTVLAVALLLLAPVVPARADETAALRSALARVAARDWQGAQAAAAGAGPLGRDIVEWHRLRAGQGLLGEYEAFLARRGDWPGLPLLRQRGEEAVARSNTPARIIGYFGRRHPATAEGSIALVQALAAAGRDADARTEAQRAWLALPFTAEDEARLLAFQPQALARMHEARLDHLLWDGEGREAEARRMLARVSPGWQALAAARMALRAESNGVDALVAAVPPALAGDPGLAYERFVWRVRKGRMEDAAALILERSTNPAALGDPGEWAPRRARVTRWLLERGQAELAYKVASRHWVTSGGDFADLEFLSGFIALRHLNQPETALAHFRYLATGVGTAISLSRAFYWEGRALEAMAKPDAARAAYEEAAMHQTAYYGLLAAEKLGQTLDIRLLSEERPADWRTAGFANSSVLAAARLLLRAGDADQAKRFILHLAEGLTGPELDQLADLVLAMDEPHVAVLLGKQGAERGVILPRAYFPVTGLVPEDGLPVTRALALAIARRESEFNPVVVSPAGARGLMQVMPGTAQMMATRVGTDYVASKLTSDPGYNVRMGTAYLAQLVEEFGPSIALVASGYNAGPGRPRNWITEFGDPRRADVDVVDWVETIPFAETRTYVMRVAESLVIYRAKLAGRAGPVRITDELKG